MALFKTLQFKSSQSFYFYILSIPNDEKWFYLNHSLVVES